MSSNLHNVAKKIFTFCIEHAKLRCITKLKAIYAEPSISLQNVKKPAEECSFLS